MIFKTAYKKGNKYLVKLVGLENDTDETWATTSVKVYNWAKKNFNDGDEVNAEYSEKNGSFFVSRITGGKGSSKKTEEPKDEAPEFVCEVCGKELKDGKYTKCYTCNQKAKTSAPATSSASGRPDYGKGAPYGSLLPEEALRRNKLSCLSCACEAVQVLQGHVSDADTIGEAVKELYNQFLKIIS